jgi:hypothetical protein
VADSFVPLTPDQKQTDFTPDFVQAQKDWEPLVRGQAIGLANMLNLDADGTLLVADAISRARIAGYCRGVEGARASEGGNRG